MPASFGRDGGLSFIPKGDDKWRGTEPVIFHMCDGSMMAVSPLSACDDIIRGSILRLISARSRNPIISIMGDLTDGEISAIIRNQGTPPMRFIMLAWRIRQSDHESYKRLMTVMKAIPSRNDGIPPFISRTEWMALDYTATTIIGDDWTESLTDESLDMMAGTHDHASSIMPSHKWMDMVRTPLSFMSPSEALMMVLHSGAHNWMMSCNVMMMPFMDSQDIMTAYRSPVMDGDAPLTPMDESDILYIQDRAMLMRELSAPDGTLGLRCRSMEVIVGCILRMTHPPAVRECGIAGRIPDIIRRYTVLTPCMDSISMGMGILDSINERGRCGEWVRYVMYDLASNPIRNECITMTRTSRVTLMALYHAISTGITMDRVMDMLDAIPVTNKYDNDIRRMLLKSDTVIIDEGMMRTRGMPIARPALMLSAWVRSNDRMYPSEFLMESSFREWEDSACPIRGILDRIGGASPAF